MRKIFVIFAMACIIYACNPTTCQHKSETEETSEYIEYTEVYCPECNGVGVVKASVASRIILGIITLGPGALVETSECPVCNGKGILKRPVINDTIKKEIIKY